MMAVDRLRQSWAGLAAYRLRSLLTVVSITIGVAAMVSVLAIGRGANQEALAEFRDIGGDVAYIRADPRNQVPVRLWPTDAHDAKALVPGVSGAWPILVGGGVQIRYGDQVVTRDVIGIPPEVGKVLWRRLQVGRFLVDSDDAATRRRAVLGSKLAEGLLAGRPAVGQVIFVNDQPFEVTGVLSPSSELVITAFGLSNDETLLLPIQTLRRMAQVLENATVLMVQVDPGRDPDAVGLQVAAVLQRLHGGARFRTDTLRGTLESFTRIAGLVTNVMAVIAGVAMAAGGMGITNIMLASVTERTREIGIRRAVGAHRRDIFWQFVLEAVLLSGVGGLVGIPVAWVPVLIARRWMPLHLHVTWDAALAGLFLAVLLGLIFGVWPAWRAARMEPADALRYEI